MIKNISVRNQKGMTGIDLSIAILILIIFVTLILTVFSNVYLTTTNSSRKATATNYATQILEYAMTLNYDELETELDDYVNGFVVAKGYTPTVTIEKYSEGTPGKNDIIKIVEVNIKYKVAKVEQTLTMTTLKTKTASKWNVPKLVDGMTAIKWNEENSEWVDVDNPNEDINWYNYDEKKWANIKLVDDSMFVWIPRYAYKITYYNSDNNKKLAYDINSREGIVGYSNSNGIVGTDGVTTNTSFTRLYGKIDVIFLSETSKTLPTGYEDYRVHPAFTFKEQELTGIWVGKFESSDDGTGKVKVVPDITSFRNININNAFTKAQAFSENNNLLTIDSHMMKNTEWGAVAYLASSNYGRGSTIITSNKLDYLTGGGDYKANINQSTTGNVYGIYDMAGGASEFVMAVLNNQIGSSGFANLPDSKYYNNYETASSVIYGDAIYETSGWNGNLATAIESTNTWIARGGAFNDMPAGMFNYGKRNGISSVRDSFRMVMVGDSI